MNLDNINYNNFYYLNKYYYIIIIMLDLYNNEYDRQTLKNNIYDVKLIDILKTQKLDVTFIIRYILNNLYQLTNEDKKINVDLVLKFQPHITKYNLMKTLNEYDSDDDSVQDFETVSINSTGDSNKM